MNYIPVINSAAGLCLTTANWQEAEINAGSFYLESLLIKPGLDLLREIQRVKEYFAWPGVFILNAGTIKANKQGLIELSSPYDGSKVRSSLPELMELIAHLHPDQVILPQGITIQDLTSWACLPDGIFPYLAAEGVDLASSDVDHGIYYFLDEDFDLTKFKKPQLSSFVFGNVSLEQMQQLNQIGIESIECNEPAAFGLQGKVYTSAGVVDLTHANNEHDFSVIDLNCRCSTCSQQFTRAYLHHLFLHTPLLCQRFLIEHNVRIGMYKN